MLTSTLAHLDDQLRTYRGLASMLDEQFETARALDATRLAQVTEAIDQELNGMEGRRREHADLLRSARDLARRRPADRARAAQHALLDRRCTELKSAAAHCKTLALRNGELLASQYELMRRVIQGESHTYAPG